MLTPRSFFAGIGAALIVVCMLGATAGGFPSRPRFQTVTIAGPSNATVTSLSLRSTNPQADWYDSSAAADGRRFNCVGVAASFQCRMLNDAGSTAAAFLAATRSGTAVTSVALGNATDNPTITANGIDLTPLSGSFTVSLPTGCTTTPTATVFYRKVGTLVSLHVGALGSCTSDSTQRVTDASIPAALRPSASCAPQMAMPYVTDSSAQTWGSAQVSSSGTVTYIKNGNVAGGFTASGATSLPEHVLTYPLC